MSGLRYTLVQDPPGRARGGPERHLEPHLAEPAPPSIATVGAYLRGPAALFDVTTPVHAEVPV